MTICEKDALLVLCQNTLRFLQDFRGATNVSSERAESLPRHHFDIHDLPFSINKLVDMALDAKNSYLWWNVFMKAHSRDKCANLLRIESLQEIRSNWREVISEESSSRTFGNSVVWTKTIDLQESTFSKPRFVPWDQILARGKAVRKPLVILLNLATCC